MPDIGEGIAEVELGAWHVAVGDTVTEDQSLADVMTDKASVEIPSPVSGKVVALGGKVGEVLAVGSELIRLEVEGDGNVKAAAVAAAPERVSVSIGGGEDEPRAEQKPAAGAGVRANAQAASVGSFASSVAERQREPQQAASQVTHAHSQAQSHAPARVEPLRHEARAAATAQVVNLRQPDERPLASPAVRKRAWDMGVELRFVQGTGEAGRIGHADLDAYAQSSRGASSAVVGRAGYVERNDETAVPVIGLRRVIARKMQEAKRRIPHFSYVEEIDVTELEHLRKQLNQKWGESRGRLTMLPLLIRAMVIALRDFPQINARYDDEGGVVTRYGAVHVGVATQTDAGLSVPVLHHAEARDVWQMAAEIVRLAEATRSGKATRDELSGSTITISSLGALGGIVSTPVINHPEVGIVGVNRMVERPVIRDGAVVARKMMNLSSSFDHRVVDGMDAAEFIQAVRGLLEQPALLFVE
jgi:2-oxoisovalerate dehydrogenase E2 component (dihydrolipoyl transacylase)